MVRDKQRRASILAWEDRFVVRFSHVHIYYSQYSIGKLLSLRVAVGHCCASIYIILCHYMKLKAKIQYNYYSKGSEWHPVMLSNFHRSASLATVLTLFLTDKMCTSSNAKTTRGGSFSMFAASRYGFRFLSKSNAALLISCTWP